MNYPILKRICTFLFVLTVSFSNAQVRFQKTIGGAILDWSNCIIQTSDSNYVLLGSTKNFGAGAQDMFLMKTNILGDSLWVRTYGMSSGDEEGATVQQTADGGFIITGTTWSTGAGSLDFMLIKTDANGNIQWSKTYGGTSVEFCSGGIQLFDGGYALCGHTNSYGAGAADIYIIRTDANGDTIWTRTAGFNGTDNAFGIVQTADSGLTVTGSMFTNSTTDAVLIKMDINGNLSWAKAYGAAQEEIGYSLILTNDNGFGIGGSTTSFGNGGMDAFIIKTNEFGDITWSNAFGTTDSDLIYNMKQTSDGGYVATGNANRIGNLRDDLFIFKADASGNLVWSDVMGGTTAARDVGRSVFETNEGAFIVSGFTQSFGGGTEAYFIKTDLLGSAGCNMITATVNGTTAAHATTNISPTIKAGSIVNSPAVISGSAQFVFNTLCSTIDINENATILSSAYPNPMKNEATITINSNALSKLTLSTIHGQSLEDIIGNLNGTQTTFSIIRNDKPAGIYLYSITDANGKLQSTGKLIIQD